ncbi:MAG: transposase, partial [Actinomycetota bacterium]|nr:transposase [Actinomycetota bacterium]
NHAKVRATIDAIADDASIDIDYSLGGRSQVAETAYLVGGGTTKRKQRTVRLVVRRTRLSDPTQLRLWPEWRHHAFITNRDDLTCVAADQFHREHAVVELAIRDLKAGGAEHIPSGHYAANAAWLGCAVIAHNLTRWTCLLGNQTAVTNTTFRTRITAVPAVVVNRSGRPTLRLPTRWPWATNFIGVLAALRALPGPSG